MRYERSDASFSQRTWEEEDRHGRKSVRHSTQKYPRFPPRRGVLFCIVRCMILVPFVIKIMPMINYYSSKPTTFRTEIRPAHQAYPHVTVCNVNPVRRSALQRFQRPGDIALLRSIGLLDGEATTGGSTDAGEMPTTALTAVDVSNTPSPTDPIGMLAVDSVLFEFCTDGVDRSASFDFNTAGGWTTKQPIYGDDLPIVTSVVGIHAKNLGGAGGLFLSSEIASTGSVFWKFLREPPSGDWCEEYYGDAAWTPAVLYDYRGESWLWYKTGGDDRQDVWFRWERKCVIKEFENATIIGHKPGTVVNISQPVTLLCKREHVTPENMTMTTSTCDKNGKWSVNLEDCRLDAYEVASESFWQIFATVFDQNVMNSSMARDVKAEKLMPEIMTAVPEDERPIFGMDVSKMLVECEINGLACNHSGFRLVNISYWYDNSQGNCMTVSPANPEGESQGSKSPGYDLQLHLNPMESEYLAIIPKTGFRVTIHAVDEPVIAGFDSINLPPGKTLLRAAMTETTSLYDCMGKPDPTSYFYEGSYTVKGCEASCIQGAIIASCGCGHTTLARPPGIPECTYENFNCTESVLLRVPIDCECFMPCKEFHFSISSSSARTRRKSSSQTSDTCSKENCTGTLTKLEVIVDRLLIVSHEVYAYNFYQLLSDCGGWMGVLLSFSLVSWVELVFDIGTIFGGPCRQQRTARDATYNGSDDSEYDDDDSDSSGNTEIDMHNYY